MSDLASGRYAQQEYWWRLLGMPSNATLASLPVRTNLSYLCTVAAIVDQGQAATTEGWMVAIPVEEGYIISKVTVLVGATKSAANPNAVAAIYSGTSAAVEASLVGSSAKATGETVMTENKAYSLSLETPVIVNSTNAPHGYIYAGIAQESAEIASCMGGTTPKAIFNKVLAKFSSGPPSFACAMTVASAGVASAKLKVATAVETAPIVFLQ